MLTNKKNWAIKKDAGRFYANTAENPSCKIVNMISARSNDLLFREVYEKKTTITPRRFRKDCRINNGVEWSGE